IWAPGNKWAAAEGVDDSVDAGLRYLEGLQTEGDGELGLSSCYVRGMSGLLRELEETTAVTWQHMVGFTDYHAELPGGSEGGRGLEIQPIEVSEAAWSAVRRDP